MDFLDTYSIKARLFPALVAMAPALSLFLMAGSWTDPGFPEAITAMTIGVLFFAAADLARRAGKHVEARMLKATGGRHENRELTFEDTTIEQATKARYREFLAAQVGIAAPTRESETQDSAAARSFYAACYDYLRLNTYDTEKFRILFNENIAYGYLRNLLGLKPYAIGINIAAALAAWALYKYPPPFASMTDGKLMIQAGLAVWHVLYLSLGVTERSVLAASKRYARQLTFSCETLILNRKV
ncbi:hypothetical protein BFN67_23010 [Pseudaminobacter manganicus]|uniref:Uncharacterized protein n=2 Tax=Manganibacter manganicus TaxID=1873176 RepID=A0A1V8RLN2_9HYPH|nr:hypothetical protein BFN67_23010 [Pseudaminobacter manganicus]